MSNIEKQKPGILDVLRSPGALKQMTQIAAGSVDVERFSQICITEIRKGWYGKNGDLALGKCDPFSILTAVLECCQLNLVPGDEFYFVPFQTTCVGMLGYKGMLRLPLRYGAVVNIGAKVRYANDEFDLDEINGQPEWRHRRAVVLGRPKGEPLFSYCYWETRTGHRGIEICDTDRFEEARKASKTKTLYSQNPDKAWMKTAVRNAWPLIPKEGVPTAIIQAIEDDVEREFKGPTDSRVPRPDWARAVLEAPPQSLGELEPSFPVDGGDEDR